MSGTRRQRERLRESRMGYPEGYCDYCEKEGHTFSTCPQRDDSWDVEPMEVMTDEEIRERREKVDG